MLCRDVSLTIDSTKPYRNWKQDIFAQSIHVVTNDDVIVILGRENLRFALLLLLCSYSMATASASSLSNNFGGKKLYCTSIV